MSPTQEQMDEMLRRYNDLTAQLQAAQEELDARAKWLEVVQDERDDANQEIKRLRGALGLFVKAWENETADVANWQDGWDAAIDAARAALTPEGTQDD